MATAETKRLTSRTGTLRRSIGVNRRGLPFYIDVGSDVEYARIHELGGGNIRARPYLSPALEAIAPQMRAIVNKHLAREIEGSPF